MGNLTALGVKSAVQPGRYSDGDGLSLVVKTDRRAWVLRVQRNGRTREYGLGSAADVSLAQARAEAAKLRGEIRADRDPRADALAAKAKAEADAKADADAKAEVAKRTFETVARKLHGNLAPGLRNAKHAAQWLSTLEAHAFPAFGAKPVAVITGTMVLDALEPIWTRTPETARRTLQRIGAVLDFAHAREWRDEAPNLKKLAAKGLAPQTDAGGHHAAVDYEQAPAVLAKLRDAAESTGRLALLFTIYTAARSGETRGATWGEVDMEAGLWTIPGARMKAGREHVVPLSVPALAILERAKAGRLTDLPSEMIFPGARGRPISDMTMAKAHKLIAPGTTVHGWRSAFRDWAGEATSFASDVCEAALAHAVGNKVQRAYQRGTMLERRREVMDAWAAYLAPVATDARVVDLASRRAKKQAV